MATAEDQAKQLDSVTDNVREHEVDSEKAQQAMSSLLSSKAADAAVEHQAVAVSKADIDLIVQELEVSEETATRALREVAPGLHEGESLVKAALRKLITS